MNDLVIVEIRQKIATVSLNLPAKRNALTPELRARLREAMQTIMKDDAVRAIILTGNGGAFCSGGDITQMSASDPASARPRLAGTHDIVRMIAHGPKPVIAAVEGAAYGAGLALAAASDVCVATPDSRFCASFVRLGLVPDGGLMWSLPPRVGLGQAKRIMFQCPVIDGRTALTIGLADELTATGAALAAAREHAERLAGMAPRPIAMMKAAYATGLRDLEATFALELELQMECFGSADHAEGRDAFFSRRNPSFLGR